MNKKINTTTPSQDSQMLLYLITFNIFVIKLNTNTTICNYITLMQQKQ